MRAARDDGADAPDGGALPETAAPAGAGRAPAEAAPFRSGSGAPCGLMAGTDWDASPLGPPGTWPPALRTAVQLMLRAEAEIVLFWGADYVALYNAAYAPTIGAKHPRAFGRPARENWSELWDDLAPLLRQVRETGRSVAAKDRPFRIDRHGYLEEVYFDISYSAVPEEDGVGGVLCIVSETTARVLSERHQRFLLGLERDLRGLDEPGALTAAARAALVHHLGPVSVRCGVPGVELPACLGPLLSAEAGGADGPAGPPVLAVHDGPADPRLAGLAGLEDLAGFAGPAGSADAPAGAMLAAALGDGSGAALLVESAAPRRWRPDEADAVAAAAERLRAVLGRARAAAALRAAEARLQLAKDAADVGVWDYDAATGTVRWSARAFRLWGRAPPEGGEGTVPVAEMLAAIHPEDRSRVRAEIGRTLRQGVPFRCEFRVVTAEGVRWLAALGHVADDGVAGARTPGRAGRGRGSATLIGVNLDVTARHRVEEELRRLNETLEERVEARTRELVEAQAALAQSQKMEAVGQLTGGIAHDFNNLLTVISGNLEMALRRLAGGDAARAERMIGSALDGAGRAAVLTHRLLAFARRQTLAPDTLVPNALVSGMTELLGRTLGELVTLEIDLAPDLWPVRVDPSQLENALLNLAVNARDAMLEGEGLAGGGRLAIATRNLRLDPDSAARADLAPGRYVAITVTDTGAGMPEAVRARVFEPFFTTKPQGKGTGLGLAMVFGFMKQSGGGVRVDSAPGAGTTVRLLLPACEAEAAGPGAPAPAEAALRPDRAATVLLVEDQAEVGDVAEALLADAGYRVLRAADGVAAQAILAREPGIDLLFSDVVMPGGLTGVDLARAARAARPGLAVLLATGYAHAALQVRGAARDGFPVLDKPYRRADLLARVREALGAAARPDAPAAGLAEGVSDAMA